MLLYNFFKTSMNNFNVFFFLLDESSTHSTYNQRQRFCTLGKVRSLKIEEFEEFKNYVTNRLPPH